MEGVLTEEQIGSIADEFDLDVDDMRELSVALGASLNPKRTPNRFSVEKSRAADGAQEQIGYAYKAVWAAEDKLDDALERLQFVDPDPEEDREGSEQFRETKELLGQISRLMRKAGKSLAELSSKPHVAVMRTPPDKRLIPDGRRGFVLGHIFQLWQAAGRRLSFTTPCEPA